MGSDRPAHPSRLDAEQLAVLDHAERMGMSGSWEWTPSTGELHWSDNYFRLLGLEPGSITPGPGVVLGHAHPRDRDRIEAALAILAAGGAFETLDYRIVRDDDVVRHVRATLAFVDAAEGRPRRLVGSVQDVTAQDSVARKLGAHTAVSKALDEWQEFDRGGLSLLAGFSTAMHMSFGALWVPERAVLAARVVWHLDDPALAKLGAVTRNPHPGYGGPTLGRAWKTRQPVASNDPAGGKPPRRAAAIRDAGIEATAHVGKRILELL